MTGEDGLCNQQGQWRWRSSLLQLLIVHPGIGESIDGLYWQMVGLYDYGAAIVVWSGHWNVGRRGQSMSGQSGPQCYSHLLLWQLIITVTLQSITIDWRLIHTHRWSAHTLKLSYNHAIFTLPTDVNTNNLIDLLLAVNMAVQCVRGLLVSSRPSSSCT